MKTRVARLAFMAAMVGGMLLVQLQLHEISKKIDQEERGRRSREVLMEVDVMQSAAIVAVALAEIINVVLAKRNQHDNDLRLLALEHRCKADAKAEEAD